MSDITSLLVQIGAGDQKASQQLLAIVYDELRSLAKSKLQNERDDHTLQATALVHEAYLRLAGPLAAGTQDVRNRGYFFAAAAEAMRRILIESVRQKKSQKRGGDRTRVSMEFVNPTTQKLTRDDRLEALDVALSRFERVDPIKARLVMLRVFSGLTLAESAEALNISTRTADRYWTFARAWLLNEVRQRESQ